MAAVDGGLLNGLAKAWLADPRGKVLLSSWAITFVGVTTRAVFQRRRKNKLLREQHAAAAKKATTSKAPAASPIKMLLRRAIPGWKSRPVAWAIVLSAGIGIRIVVQIKVSSEIGVLGSLLAQRRWEELFTRQLGYALYGLPAAVFVAFQKYAAANVALALRSNLMRKVHAGLGGSSSLPRVYAQADPAAKGEAGAGGAAAGGADGKKQESAVQLATGDVAAFCTEAVTLYESMVKPTMEVVILSSTLGSMMGVKPLLQCYGYFFIAGSWTRYVSPSFATMTEDVQQAEGTLLDGHTRLHAYAEEVTMLNGATAEASSLEADLSKLSAASAHLSLQRFLSESMDGYVLRYLGILSAFTAMLPAVYHGIGTRANEDPTEYFLTCLHLLVNVGLALRDLVGSFKIAASARGYATRIETLYSAIEAVPTSAASLTAKPGTGDVVLALDKLCVAAPDGVALVKDLCMRLTKGQRVVVRGPNGAGKSSILRVLSGVWAPSGGSIASMPPRSTVAFLPQRAYVPERMPLRAILSYPHAADGAGAPADDKLIAALRFAGLGDLLPSSVSHKGALNGAVGKLSGGEMQRLMIARLVLHPPALAILDEATSNLEAAFEAKFFEWAASSGLTLLSVSHSAEVVKHHTHELSLDASGKCTFKPL